MNILAKYLTFVYPNGTYALDDFSVQIESGDFVTVLGESGCGKSSFLRILSGLEKPTAGELYFDGVLYSDTSLKQRDTATVFQEYVLYPKMTVWENVATALQRYKLPREEEDRLVKSALSEFGLLRFRNQLPKSLSGGQQQRVALARAIVRKPTLLLFDEPLSNIAEEQRHEYVQIIKELKVKLPQTTFIYVTHNLKEAKSLGNKTLIMSEGRVLQFGNKHDVWKAPRNAEVLRTLIGETREYIGDIANGKFISGEVELPVNLADEEQVTMIINALDNNRPVYFNENGEAIENLPYIELDGTYDGDSLKFCGISREMGNEFKLRFLGKYGDVKIRLDKAYLRAYSLLGDVSIELNGEKVHFSPDAIELYQNGERVLAHYCVYSPKCNGKIISSQLMLPSGRLRVDNRAGGNVRFWFKRDCKVYAVKKGGVRATCIAEEYIGDKKLAYFIIKGFDRYVTLYADKSEKFFSNKKLRIVFDTNRLNIEKY